MSTHNPPAFPVSDAVGPSTLGDYIKDGWATGMSLRDYFAAAALQGMCARDLRPAGEKSSNLNDHHNHADVRRLGADAQAMAWHAYDYADAMLAARQQPKEQV